MCIVIVKCVELKSEIFLLLLFDIDLCTHCCGSYMHCNSNLLLSTPGYSTITAI